MTDKSFNEKASMRDKALAEHQKRKKTEKKQIGKPCR
jgi:hypothetical protein